jgi:gluconolactonase
VRRTWWSALLGGLLVSLCSPGGGGAAEYPTFGSIERLDPRLAALIPADARIEVLASGFEWAEGPVWVRDEGGYLLFSDIPKNQILRWSEEEGIEVYLEPAGYTGRGGYSGEP